MKPSAPPRTAAAACALLLAGIVRAGAAQQVTILEPESIGFRADARMPGVSVAVVAGNPSRGPYTIRVRFAPNTRVPPHTHPDERTVTVLSGTYLFAAGERFDAGRLRPHGAGTVIIVPAGVPHFVAAGDGAVELQESGIGPTASHVLGDR